MILSNPEGENTLLEILKVFPHNWSHFGIAMAESYVEACRKGGIFIQTNEDIYESLKILEDMQLLRIGASADKLVVKVKRLAL